LDDSWINAVRSTLAPIAMQTDDVQTAQRHLIKALRSHPAVMEVQYSEVVSTLLFNVNFREILHAVPTAAVLLTERLHRIQTTGSKIGYLMTWCATQIAGQNFAIADAMLSELLQLADTYDVDTYSQWIISLQCTSAIRQRDLDSARKHVDALRMRQRKGTVLPLRVQLLLSEAMLALTSNDKVAARRSSRRLAAIQRRHQLSRDLSNMVTLLRVRCLEMIGDTRKATLVASEHRDRNDTLNSVLVYQPFTHHLDAGSPTAMSNSELLSSVLKASTRMRSENSALSTVYYDRMIRNAIRTTDQLDNKRYEQASQLRRQIVLDDLTLARLRHDVKYLRPTLRKVLAVPGSLNTLLGSLKQLVATFRDRSVKISLRDLAKMCTSTVTAYYPDDVLRVTISFTDDNALRESTVGISQPLIQSCITNLVGNALRHSPRSSIVRVDLSEDVQGVSLSVTNALAGNDASALSNIRRSLAGAADARSVVRQSGSSHGFGLSILASTLRQTGNEITASATTDQISLTVVFSKNAARS
jgi:signal transduction histidine kinase